uniref:Inter-alpha-trypsin inhibitor heavy chain family member 6 n=1 Tax=Oncorhynchus mykiss TaxID=8022 RepID=A0A8K9Y843_ONCMY
VTDYHVRCSVISRYSHTTIQSSVWNQLAVTKEAAFEVDLPSAAFISNFTIYHRHHSNTSLLLCLHLREREIEKFRMAVSVPSGSRISFSLSYEELLPRRLGRYELILGLRPGGLVTNLTLDVSIAERTGLRFVKVLPLKSSRRLSNTVTGETEAPASTEIQQNPCCARVHYNPSLQQQSSVSSKGLNADYIIQYDVELSDLMGDIQVFDGYFAHYFAPRGLPVVPKDVIFVIDVSGSMIGTKIKQTKQAMSTILGDLREGDHFNIITFSDKVLTWKKGRTVRATRNNVRDAKEFVKRIIAEGWTNINAALLSAAQLVNPSASSSSSSGGFRRVPLVIFLTDGEATIGVTSGDSILSNAKSALGSASLFGLAFGDDADYPLLRRLALDNRGMARMVYEDTDAALQLKGFYDEVASPLLSDIQLTYLDDQAFDVTRSLFPNYFQGSELVVTGKVKPGVRNLKVSLTASDSKQKVKIENDVLVSKGEENGTAYSMGCPGGMGGISSFVRRLWAYFTIKELLLAKLNSTDLVMQKLLGEKATNLSLKFNFVTPVTSLVVVKPDADEIPTTASTTTAQPATTTTTKPTTTNTTSITVDGHLMWAPSKQDVEDRSRTYFDEITISAAMGGRGGLGGIVITLSLDAVVVEGEGRDTLPTNLQGSVTRQGVAVSVDTTDDIHQSCRIELAKDICFLVLFHHYKQPSYLQMAHLGFYITDGQGLSPSTQGLLGQFQHADMSVTPVKDPSDTPPQPSKEGVLSRGVLRWGAIHVPITLQEKTLKDTVRKRHLGRCWIVPKAQVEKLLGHPYQSYLVDNM